MFVDLEISAAENIDAYLYRCVLGIQSRLTVMSVKTELSLFIYVLYLFMLDSHIENSDKNLGYFCR